MSQDIIVWVEEKFPRSKYVKELLKYELVKKRLRDLDFEKGRNRNTLSSYIITLGRFCKKFNTNPDELLKLELKKIKEMVKDFASEQGSPLPLLWAVLLKNLTERKGLKTQNFLITNILQEYCKSRRFYFE